jgi:hypothetical protein
VKIRVKALKSSLKSAFIEIEIIGNVTVFELAGAVFSAIATGRAVVIP